jgi:hypothetical protein
MIPHFGELPWVETFGTETSVPRYFWRSTNSVAHMMGGEHYNLMRPVEDRSLL